MPTFKRRLRTAVQVLRAHGPLVVARMVVTRLAPWRQVARFRRATRRSDGPLSRYAFVRRTPIGPEPPSVAPDPATIVWFIPPFGEGSGGHLNIFRFAHNLEQSGYVSHVVIVGGTSFPTGAVAKERIAAWFFPISGTVYLDPDDAPPCHLAMATAWQTAYIVRDFRAATHKGYFVQDFEPWFYPAGGEAAFAAETYRFGFTAFTSGTWLRDKLAKEYGTRTRALGFSYDRSRYEPHARRDTADRRVFFYARPPTPRRGFDLGVLVLDELTRRLPDVTVVFAGWDVSGNDIPFNHVNAGIVPLDDLPALYSQCDAALVLSFSNLSLLPLELMACGVPVVSNRAPCTQWLLDDTCARLVDPQVEEMAAAIAELLEDADLRARLSADGLARARASDWTREAQRLATFIADLDRRPDDAQGADWPEP